MNRSKIRELAFELLYSLEIQKVEKESIEEQIKTIVEVFSPQRKPSPIIYCPEKPIGGGFLMDISNARLELGYVPQYSCKKLFEAYKQEMLLNRFQSLLEK